MGTNKKGDRNSRFLCNMDFKQTMFCKKDNKELVNESDCNDGGNCTLMSQFGNSFIPVEATGIDSFPERMLRVLGSLFLNPISHLCCIAPAQSVVCRHF